MRDKARNWVSAETSEYDEVEQYRAEETPTFSGFDRLKQLD